jgi:hypothetical protein
VTVEPLADVVELVFGCLLFGRVGRYVATASNRAMSWLQVTRGRW